MEEEQKDYALDNVQAQLKSAEFLLREELNAWRNSSSPGSSSMPLLKNLKMLKRWTMIPNPKAHGYNLLVGELNRLKADLDATTALLTEKSARRVELANLVTNLEAEIKLLVPKEEKKKR